MRVQGRAIVGVCVCARVRAHTHVTGLGPGHAPAAAGPARKGPAQIFNSEHHNLLMLKLVVALTHKVATSDRLTIFVLQTRLINSAVAPGFRRVSAL